MNDLSSPLISRNILSTVSNTFISVLNRENLLTKHKFLSCVTVFFILKTFLFNLGSVRLTLFRNKNMWGDDQNGMFGTFRSSKDNKNIFKIAF